MTEPVSVIIPAYNAAGTIGHTLLSVRRQTHREIEILVVDDGSTDATTDIVERHAREDPRIRLIRQENGGVAAARNHGIAQAGAELVAPVDADDLWLPTKVEKQLAALRGGDERVGLVYTWFAVIDEHGRIIDARNSQQAEGDVLQRMCMGNLVGNGSSPLMRKQAVIEAGGYDPGLRAQDAQGCEDLKLYFAIAEKHHFAVVREQLTGYRWTPQNMSSDGTRMLRSYDLVMDSFRARYPQYGAEFHYGRGFIIEWLFQRAIRYGSLKSAAELAGALFRHERSWAARAAWRGLETALRAPPFRKRIVGGQKSGEAMHRPAFLGPHQSEKALTSIDCSNRTTCTELNQGPRPSE